MKNTQNENVTAVVLLNRSEEAQEILSTVPGWIVRWGTTLFFLMIVGVVLMSYLLHYPDIIKAPFTLTSRNAPKVVKTKVDGKLTRLLVAEGQPVAKGEVLAFLESTARHEDVLRLHAWLDRVSALLLAGNARELLKVEKPPFNRLGEVQSAYQAFDQAHHQYLAFLSGKFYQSKKKLLEQDLQHLLRQAQNLADQQQLYQRNLKLAQDEFATQQQLADEKVIAPMEHKRNESRLLEREIALKEMESALVGNLAQQTDKRKEILELEKVMSEQSSAFMQALNTFKSSIESWDQKYILRAPAEGQISFFSFIQENQALRAGQEMFFVHSAGGEEFGEIRISQFNLGKIKCGQVVLVKFDSYPFQEFGAVQGRIDYIAPVSGSDSTYLARVALPGGLLTNYRRKLTYKAGMTATAEIITEDMRLIEKLFVHLKKAASR